MFKQLLLLVVFVGSSVAVQIQVPTLNTVLVGTDSVILSWNRVTNATSYTV